MKQLKLSQINLPVPGSIYSKELLYWIILGNGIKRSFTSKAEATIFLNGVNKYLTYKMHEINELYISAFTYYRRSWFYFDHSRKGNPDLAILYKKDRDCAAALNNIEKSFELLYGRQKWKDSNYYVFMHFDNMIRNLKEIVNNLKYLYEGKSMSEMKFELEILNKKINYCKRTIDNYCDDLSKDTEVEKIELSIVHSA